MKSVIASSCSGLPGSRDGQVLARIEEVVRRQGDAPGVRVGAVAVADERRPQGEEDDGEDRERQRP